MYCQNVDSLKKIFFYYYAPFFVCFGLYISLVFYHWLFHTSSGLLFPQTSVLRLLVYETTCVGF